MGKGSNYILIPTGGARPDLLERTLNFISKAAMLERIDRLIVIENGCGENCRSIVEQARMPCLTEYRYVSQPGKSLALNVVLEEIRNGLAIFFDDDVRVSDRVISEYLKYRLPIPGKYFYGGSTGSDFEETPPTYVFRACPLSVRGLQLRCSGETQVIPDPRFLGFNWAAHIEDILALGGFDTNRGPGASTNAVGQEQNMQYRLVERGLSGLYLPNASVNHYIPRERSSVEWVIERGFRGGRASRLEGRRRGGLNTIARGARLFAKQITFEALALSGSKYWFLMARKGRRMLSGFLQKPN